MRIRDVLEISKVTSRGEGLNGGMGNSFRQTSLIPSFASCLEKHLSPLAKKKFPNGNLLQSLQVVC